MNLLCELENFIISINKTSLFIWNWKQQMFTMNNEKRPPEVFYKKAVLKNFLIFTGKHLCWSLFLIKLQVLRSAALSKKNFNTSEYIVKFLKMPILKKICERLPLFLFSHKYFSTFEENTCTRVPLLINVNADLQFKPIFIQKEVPHWCFPYSYLKFLTTPFF